jgi:tetratricopeptide (TPR) repeat protein
MAEGSPADPGHFFARVLAGQHYQKGRQRQEQGDWDLALGSYRRACALDPHNVLYLLARGHVCQAHGLEPEAEECYRVALELRPEDTVALYNQAQLLASRGQLDEARANLFRIVSAGVEDLGERAAPIFCRLGEIAVRREDYPAAAVHFRRALECTPGHRYASAALGGLARFAEFRQPFDAGGGVHPKVAFYGFGGTILLGLPGDDGIAVPAYPGLGFDSLAELGQTLARFTELARHLGWRFDAVAALDSASRPLAIALGRALDAAVVEPDDGGWRGSSGARGAVLGVTGAGADPSAMARAVERLRDRGGRVLLYAVGVSCPVWEYDPPLHVASAPGTLEFPWSRGEASAPEHAEAFGAELGEALLAALAGGTAGVAEAQARWYGLPSGLPSEQPEQPAGGHSRIGFDPRTLEARPALALDRPLLDCIAY